jgi:hypothetical protein
MASTTTIAVSPETRDALRLLAAHGGDTMDSLIRRMIRNERARLLGASLAERHSSMSGAEAADERHLLAGSATAVARALG